MAKILPEVLVILGVLWLIRDLYAFESDHVFPHEKSDFYFDESPMSLNLPDAFDDPSNFPPEGVPLQPHLPEESKRDKQPPPPTTTKTKEVDKGNVEKPANEDKPDEKPKNYNPVSQKDEKGVKNILQDFLSLLLHMSDNDESLIDKVKSYLRNGDQNNPSTTAGPPAHENSASKLNLTKPVTTYTSTDYYPDSEYDYPYKDYEDYYEAMMKYTTETPETTIDTKAMNIDTNVTEKPVNQYSSTQSTIPTTISNKLVFDMPPFHGEKENIPSDEFIDHLINPPKNSPENKDKNTISTASPVSNANKMRQKPLGQIPSNKNILGKEKVISSTTEAAIYDIGNADFSIPLIPAQNVTDVPGSENNNPQMQISTEGTNHVKPNLVTEKYPSPLTISNLHNPNEEGTGEVSTVKPMSIPRDTKTQIPFKWPFQQPNLYKRKDEPVQYYRPAPPVYNPMSKPTAPKAIYPQRIKPLTDGRHYDTLPKFAPFIPQYAGTQNKMNPVLNPTNLPCFDKKVPNVPEGEEEQNVPDNKFSAIPLNIPNNNPSSENLNKNPVSPNDPQFPYVEETINKATNCNNSVVTDNPEVDNGKNKMSPTSTEIPKQFNKAELLAQQNFLTTQTPTTESNTEKPVLKTKASNPHVRKHFPRFRPFFPRNRYRIAKPQIKLNTTKAPNKNQLNTTTALPSLDILNVTELPPENHQSTEELPPESKLNNTVTLSPRNNSVTEVMPTKPTPLSNKTEKEKSINPKNISSPVDTPQSVNVTEKAPEMKTQTSTSPIDPEEMHSEDSEEYESSDEDVSEDKADDDTDDDAHASAEDVTRANTEDVTHVNTEINAHVNTEDNAHVSTEDTIHINTEDPAHDETKDNVPASNDYDEKLKDILSILGNIKAMINNNATTMKPQHPPDHITDYSMTSPSNVFRKKETNPFNVKKPFESILEYIYSHSHNPFFDSIKGQ